MDSVKPQSSSWLFHGWTIVACTFFIQFLVMGSGYYVLGVLLKPLSESLEADRFLVSLGISLQMVMSSLLGPWLGRAIGLYSIKLLMSIGILLLATGLLVVSQATALWHFYAGFVVIASTGFALTGAIPNAALIANWFSSRRGTAMGISQFGVTFSGAALVPFFTWLMLTWGWRSALMVFALGLVVLALPLINFGITKTPEEKNLHPDGADAPPASETSGDEAATDWNISTALASPDVWKLALIVGPGFMGISAIILSIHSHLTDLGETAMRASSVIAAMTLMGAFAKPLFGTLMDYLNKRLVVLMSILLMFSGVAGIVLFTNYFTLLACSAMFGLGYGAQMPLFNILAATIFGRRSFARIIGILGLFLLPFNISGLPMTTFIFETTGSYIPAYTAILALYLVSLISLMLLKLPARS